MLVAGLVEYFVATIVTISDAPFFCVAERVLECRRRAA